MGAIDSINFVPFPFSEAAEIDHKSFTFLAWIVISTSIVSSPVKGMVKCFILLFNIVG